MVNKMVIIDPNETEVFECNGLAGVYPKKEGCSVLDTRFFTEGFHEYWFIRRNASFKEKLKILFAKY